MRTPLMRMAGRISRPFRRMTPEQRAVLSTVAIGLPPVLSAADQLDELASPGENLAAATGSALGGWAGAAALQPLGAPFGPPGRLIAGLIGAAGGAEVLSNAARGVAGMVSGAANDPDAKALRQARNAMDLQNEAAMKALPIQLANDRRAAMLQEHLMRIEGDARARDTFNQALYAAALGSPGVYNNLAFPSALASIAGRVG